MGAIAPTLLAGFLDQIGALDLYLGLVSSDPLLVGDPLAVEITGPAYVRELGNFSRVSPLTLLLGASAVFDSIDLDTVVAGVAVWDAQYNGHLVARKMLASPKSFPTGGSYTVAGGAFALGFDLTGL